VHDTSTVKTKVTRTQQITMTSTTTVSLQPESLEPQLPLLPAHTLSDAHTLQAYAATVTVYQGYLQVVSGPARYVNEYLFLDSDSQIRTGGSGTEVTLNPDNHHLQITGTPDQYITKEDTNNNPAEVLVGNLAEGNINLECNIDPQTYPLACIQSTGAYNTLYLAADDYAYIGSSGNSECLGIFCQTITVQLVASPTSP
jgi:hypothetical protein